MIVGRGNNRYDDGNILATRASNLQRPNDLLTPWLPIPLGLALVLWLSGRILAGRVNTATPKVKVSPPLGDPEASPPAE